MTPDQRERLVHVDASTFELLLRELVAADCVEALVALDSARELGLRETGRRVSLVLRTLAGSTDLHRVVTEARELSPTVRNAVSAEVPSGLRRLLFTPATEVPSADAEPPRAKRTSRNATTSGVRDDVLEGHPLPPSGGPTVLLLGKKDEHASNSSLLKNNELAPIRVSTARDLETFLEPDVCGIIVGPSWWASIPTASHEAELRRILSFSSVAYVHVATTGLSSGLAPKIVDLARECRSSDPLASQLSHSVDGRLSAPDVHHLSQASVANFHADALSFQLDSIEPAERQLLLRAIMSNSGIRKDGIRARSVPTRPLWGGRTNAKVLVIRPDGGAPLVAKLDSAEMIREEIARHERFIAPADLGFAPRPSLFVHAGQAVSITSLVQNVDDPTRPAPTLEERLELLASCELGYCPDDGRPSEEDLHQAIAWTVERLQQLNARPPAVAEELPSRCWLARDTLSPARKEGLDWYGLPRSTEELFDSAHQRAQVLEGRATIHGDVHLRNILIVDRVPVLIDFSLAGPGHPCADLVRLGAALVFGHLRQTTPHEAMVKALRDVLSGADQEQISQTYPELTASRLNRIALGALGSVRRACLAVLDPLEGGAADFRAAMTLVSLQALVYPHLQHAVVRAMLTALDELA